MNILFVTGNLSAIGGIQEYNRNFLRALEELSIPNKVISIKFGGYIGRIVFLFGFLWRIIFSRPKFIIFSHINFYPLGVPAHLLGIRYAVITYGIDVWDLNNKKRKFLSKAARIVTISRFTEEKMVQQDVDPAKLFILPPSINGDKFYPKEKRKDLVERYGLEGKKVVLTVARLSKNEGYKGYDVVIESLPEIIKKVPNVKYLLVGEGDDLWRLEKLVRERELEDVVVFCGHVGDDLVDYYNLCDAFVMPSKKEGFGIVFLEALACGKPVVAGDQDASREAIQEKLGFLVNSDNAKEVGGAIISTLKNVASKNVFNGEMLRAKTLEIFGFPVFVNRIRVLFNECQK